MSTEPQDSDSDSSLYDLVKQASANSELRREFLTAFSHQARALDSVWEAYRRGAAYLPDSVASQVEKALVKIPRILGGSSSKNETDLSGRIYTGPKLLE